jgi:glycerol-3-phosphate acyltransferase PlsY
VSALIPPIVGYLVGAVPFALLVGFAYGVDIRNVGSGNPGAGNLSRTCGVPAGALGAILDGAKSLFVVLAMRQFGFDEPELWLTGVAAVAGHNWSVFLWGRAGRGLATSAGVLVALDPALLWWTTAGAVSGWKIGGGLGGTLGWGLLPFVGLALDRPLYEVWGLIGLALLMFVRRAQGNPGHQPGFKAAVFRAVFDQEPSPASHSEQPAEAGAV